MTQKTASSSPRRRDLISIYRKLPTPMRRRNAFRYGTTINWVTALFAGAALLTVAAVAAYFLQRV